MKALFALLLLPLLTAAVLAPGTYTVPAGTTLTVPTVVPPIVCTPPQTLVNGTCTPPVTGTPAYAWIGGAFGPGWQNDDWSSNLTLVHTATQISITTTGQWGIWQPYATLLGGTPMNGTTDPDSQDGQFNVAPYTKLVLVVKAGKAPFDAQVQFEPSCLVNAQCESGSYPLAMMSKYCTISATVFTTCAIPLADVGAVAGGVVGTLVRKFKMQDQSANASNAAGGTVWYIQSASFQ